MAEIINLREFRKSRNRKSKYTSATENRARSGRNKVEMARDQAAADCAEAVIDGKKIDRSENDRPAEPE